MVVACCQGLLAMAISVRAVDVGWSWTIGVASIAGLAAAVVAADNSGQRKP